MAPAAGYNATVKLTGTSTAFTGQAASGSGTTWQISDTAKQILDPAVTPSWYDNAAPISAGDISSVDYLTGTVVFTGSKTGPITADGSYLPLLAFAEARAVNPSLSADELDVSVFGTQWRARSQGLKSMETSLESFTLLQTDMDPGGGTRTLEGLFTNGTQVVLEVDPSGVGAGYRIRSFGLLLSADGASAVDGLVTTNPSFQSVTVKAADGTYVTVSLAA